MMWRGSKPCDSICSWKMDSTAAGPITTTAPTVTSMKCSMTARASRSHSQLYLWNWPGVSASKRQIIARMLRNLAGIARRSESADVQLRYLDLIVALDPDAAADRWSRAMLRYQTGDHAGTRQDLRWLLDHETPGLDREQIL